MTAFFVASMVSLALQSSALRWNSNRNHLNLGLLDYHQKSKPPKEWLFLEKIIGITVFGKNINVALAYRLWHFWSTCIKSVVFDDNRPFCSLRGVPHTPTLRFSLKLQPKPRVLGYFDIHDMCVLLLCKNYVREVIPYNREFHTQKSKNCLP